MSDIPPPASGMTGSPREAHFCWTCKQYRSWGPNQGYADTDLFGVVERCCAECLKSLLDNGASVDAVIDENAYIVQGVGKTALLHLFMCKTKERDSVLRECHGLANFQLAMVLNAIDLAALACAELLLEYRANVNQEDHIGQTALHYASGMDRCVQMLLDHGANINATSQRGRTPLHVAAASDNYSTMKILLAAQADPNATNTSDLKPVHLLPATCSVESILLLLDHDPTGEPGQQSALLWRALRQQNWPVVQTLLALGTSLGSPESTRVSLHSPPFPTYCYEQLIDWGVGRDYLPEDARERLQDYRPKRVVFVRVAKYHHLEAIEPDKMGVQTTGDLKERVKQITTHEGDHWDCVLKLDDTVLDDQLSIDEVVDYPPRLLHLQEI